MVSRYKAQATLIGGVILLIVLVGVVLPLILQLNQAATSIGESVKLAAQIKSRALKEKVTLSFVYNGLTAVIYVNNTGTVQVTIEKIILLNKTSGEPLSGSICGAPNLICGLIDVGYASNNPLVANAPPAYDDCHVGILRHGNPDNLECLDNSGKVATLNPGDVLYISIDPALLPLLNDTVIYAESSYGVIHPVVAPPTTAQGQGGAAIPSSAIPRGLYTPISGFILWGYEALKNYTIVDVVRPPMRITTTFDRCGGIPFTSSFIYNDPQHPGLFVIYVRPSTTTYIYVFDTHWHTVRLIGGQDYYIIGYIGEYATIKSADCSGENVVVLDGWAYEIRQGSPNGYIVYKPQVAYQLSPSPAIGPIDLDGNGVVGLGLHTTLEAYNGTSYDVDKTLYGNDNIYELYLYRVYGKGFCVGSDVASNMDDVIAYRITILRHITGVDALEVHVKLNVYWVHAYYGNPMNPWVGRPMPIMSIVLLRLDPNTEEWKIAAIKTVELKRIKPYSYWVSVLFPTNRTDIYKIEIYVYDNYGFVSYDDEGAHSWRDRLVSSCFYPFDQLDIEAEVEHIIVQYYVYNPLLRKVPVVYLVNITGVPYWPNGTTASGYTFGYVNLTDLQEYWRWLLYYLHNLGIQPIVIKDWKEFVKLLGERDAPVNPVVVFLHGPILPVNSDGLVLYDPAENSYVTVSTPDQFVRWLAHMIMYRGWIVVFPYGPPLAFAWDTKINNFFQYNPNAYVTGALLSTFLQELLGTSATSVSVSYLYVPYSYLGEILNNYTVGRTSLALQAMRALRIWSLPSNMYGNYSIGPLESTNPSQSPVYNAFLGKIFYENTTMPNGSSALAVGAGYIESGKGAVVFIAASRPGVIDPRRLAALDVDLGIYVWKVLVGG